MAGQHEHKHKIIIFETTLIVVDWVKYIQSKPIEFNFFISHFCPLFEKKSWFQAETIPPQDEAEKKSREKAEIDAVVYVNNLIIRVREIEATLEDEVNS